MKVCVSDQNWKKKESNLYIQTFLLRISHSRADSGGVGGTYSDISAAMKIPELIRGGGRGYRRYRVNVEKIISMHNVPKNT